MLTAALVILIAAAIAITMFVSDRDIPPPEAVSPYAHLDERKARIYENLRDLQFEYRLGKLSDEDYQSTKVGLQKELAKVLADTEEVKAQIGEGKPAAAAPAAAKADPLVCPHCNARMPKQMKFCGECGKEMGQAS